MPDRRASAMLDSQDGEKLYGAYFKRYCRECGDNHTYWGIQLDQDLLDTINNIYPEWFKEYNMNLASFGDGESYSRNTIIPLSHSKGCPKSDDASHQRTIDKNKESLKVKLMLRRPINQLVDQGILPSLKSPPAFHEQRQKLERAKMGDFLKNKIQKRPEKQELIHQHILEDTSVDPNIHDKHRQLKKAHLADGLNDRISQRPGPLELVKVNILHADEILAQAVREGSLPFKNTCETPSPSMRISLDDDSGSDGAFSPSPPYDFSEHSQGSLPSLEASEPSPNPNQGSPCSARTSFSMSPPSSVSSPLSILPSVVSPQSQEQIPDFIIGGMHMQFNNKDMPAKNRKKTKPKTQPKARTIKFHEYKGPPNAQKSVPASSSALAESSYDLLLQQQQLFLQWQLEWQQKYPQVVLQAAQKTNGDQIGQVNQIASSTSQTQQLFESPASPQKLLSKLEDLKVSDLKAELKKRNLPVSGSKPLLIERLKTYSELPQNVPTSHHLLNTQSSNCAITSNAGATLPISVGGILLDTLPTIPGQNNSDMSPCSPLKGEESSVNGSGPTDTYKGLLSTMPTNSRPSSVLPMEIETGSSHGIDIADVNDSSSTSLSNEDIVQLQQRCIEKLQRELERSQMQLHQSIVCQQPQVTNVTSTATQNTKPVTVSYSNSTSTTTATATAVSSARSSETNEVPSAESKAAQRQIIHQYLQQKIQHQQLQLQKQRLMQEAQKQQGNSSVNTPTSTSSTNANSTLTALLESRPMNALPVSLSMSSVTDSQSNTKAVSSFPSTVMTSQVLEGKKEVNSQMRPYPGVKPILVCHVADENASKMPVLPMPNGIANNSTSSLPSFSALLSNKPTPNRSNADPQFLVARPPPDYNEATRQLNKVKQHHLSPGGIDGTRRQNKKHKSSVKCQAVDDVLEILIKNGELPPSAAQEPPTPTTPKSELTTHTMFPSAPATTEDPIFSKTHPTTSLLPNNNHQAPSHLKDNSSDLHGTSLQSVLELTPPSSAGFGDTGSGAPSSLDFEFHLDMDDIEAMDLEELDAGHHVSNNSDPTLPIHYAKEVKPHTNFGVDQPTVMVNNHLRSNEIAEFHDRVIDRGMDMDLIEWLEVLEETSGASSSSSNFHHPSYSITHDHDPLFSNVANGHDTLDLFSSEEMDFKAGHDLNLLPWDKTDFTT